MSKIATLILLNTFHTCIVYIKLDALCNCAYNIEL